MGQTDEPGRIDDVRAGEARTDDARSDDIRTDDVRSDARAGAPPAGFGVAAGLLAVAFVGATTADVLDAVGPYLLGVSALVAALFALCYR